MHEIQRRVTRRFMADVWRLAQAGVALGALYSLVAHVVNMAYLLFTGGAEGLTVRQIAAAEPVWSAFIRIIVTVPDPIAEVVILCIVLGVITYVLLKYVCESEWVQETVEVEECWEEVKWYNPWSWVKAIVCTIVEVVKWVLKQICKWVKVVVTVLVIACIVVTLIIIFA